MPADEVVAHYGPGQRQDIDLSPSADSEPARSLTRRRSLTAATIAGAAVPFLAALVTAVARNNGPPLTGDNALTDLQIHQAMHWHLLVGVYDRYGWHHPGPTYLYLVSFVERIVGANASAMAQIITASLIDFSAFAFTVYLVSREFGPRAALGVAGVLLLSVAALGPAAASDPWTPYVVVLPLVLFGVVASLSVQGWLVGVALCFVIGTFVVETDISTLPFVVVVGVLTGGVAVWRWTRRPDKGRGGLKAALITTGVGFVLWIPPIIEQFSRPPGNLTLIWRFFEYPHARLSLALAAGLSGTAAGKVLGFSAPQVRLDPVPGQHELEIILTLFVAIAAAAWMIQPSAIRFVIVGGIGLVTALVGASELIGVPFEYLLIWSTAPVILLLIAGAIVLSMGSGRIVLAVLCSLTCAGLILSTVSVSRASPKMTSSEVSTASALLMRYAPSPETVGLDGQDVSSVLLVDGVADYLFNHRRTFDVPIRYRFQFPSETLSPRPSYWAVFSTTTFDLPARFRVIANVDGTYVAVGDAAPPDWTWALVPHA